MPRRTTLFPTQSDVTRVVKGAKAGGFEIAQVRVTKDGEIVLLDTTGKSMKAPDGVDEATEAIVL